MTYKIIPAGITIIKRSKTVSVREDTEKRQHLYTVGGDIKWCNCYGNIIEVP